MFDVFGSIKHLVKVNSLCIDNVIFQMHYKFTFIMLVAFSLVVTSRQYIGDPIDCIVDSIPPPIMDTYCWIYSTFTLPNKLMGQVGKDVAHPGVASYHPNEDEIKYHKYYQWVCFALMFQAVLFYVPRYLWKCFEGNRVKTLSFEMKSPIIDEDTKNKRKKAFVNYFKSNIKTHDVYFWQFFSCEIMNFVNVLGQIFFMDFFLDGDFLTYGHKVFQFNHSDLEDRGEDPMARVFPKVTKCVFHKYGPSGGVQRFDGLCVLPVNILNEKIYVILWFWFVILTILSGLMVVYRLVMIILPCARRITLPWASSSGYKSELNHVIKSGHIGDWFILSQLEKNMDSIVYEEFIRSLAAKIDS